MERLMLWSIYMYLMQHRTKCCIQSLLWHKHMNRNSKNRIGEPSSFTDSKKLQNSYGVHLHHRTRTIGNHSKRESLVEFPTQTAEVSLLLKRSLMIRKEQERLKVWRNRILLRTNSTKKLLQIEKCQRSRSTQEYQENFKQSRIQRIFRWSTSQEKF